MDINKQKEEFSLAYVRAIAAAAGCGTSTPVPDDHSVDLQLIRRSLYDDESVVISDPQLGIQAKCTAQDLLRDDVLQFPLPVKNYQDLRNPKVCVQRILVVHTVPVELDDWLQHSEDELLLRRCSYWVSLRGRPDTTNTETVTVSIPRQNIFNAKTLLGIMERIEKGEAI